MRKLNEKEFIDMGLKRSTRYFSVKPDSPLMAKLISCVSDRDKQNRAGLEIIKRYGVKNLEEAPRLGTKEGKALDEELQALGPAIIPESFLLDEIGLSKNDYVFFSGQTFCAPTAIIGVAPDHLDALPPMAIVTLPWHDQSTESKQIMEEYRTWREGDNGFNSSKDFFLKDHAIFSCSDVIEIKKWEQEKMLHEYNEIAEKLQEELGISD